MGKPNAHGSWGPHGVDGWYVAPAWDSYQCYTIWITETKATCICDTITWFPTHVHMPTASSTNYILVGIVNIVTALQAHTENSLFVPLNDINTKALHLLMDIPHVTMTTVTKSLRVPSKEIDNHNPRLPTTIIDTPMPLPMTNSPGDQQQPPPVPLKSSAPTAPLPCMHTQMARPPTQPLWQSPWNHPGSHLVATTCTELPPPPADNATPHWALHGNAFNPDTGELAKYTELSHSSDGHL